MIDYPHSTRAKMYFLTCSTTLHVPSYQSLLLHPQAGFAGGLVIDYPHSTRAKKYFLVLMVGSSGALPVPKGLDGSEPMEEEAEGARVVGRKRSRSGAGGGGGKKAKGGVKGREWVLHKKEARRAKGLAGVAPDTKYTARKRRHLV